MSETQRLLAICGMATEAKATLAMQLAEAEVQAGRRVVIFDNNDRRLQVEGLLPRRLTGGCVCCSLAGPLRQAVEQSDADTLLLVVSALAEPQQLARMLARLRRPQRAVLSIAVLDARTAQAYLALQFATAADLIIDADIPTAALLVQVQQALTESR
ncbi:MAG: hypothetical protein MUD01_28195 [Chloroflexaceae bacterium]|nr:hypothetical protein [Chloroflexaceae bacterium]